MNPHKLVRIASLGAMFSTLAAHAQEPMKWDNDPNGVQVFILAGQSNMVGHGKAEEGHGDVKGAIGSLRYQVKNDPENYRHLVDKDGQWIVRDDVKVWWRDSDITAPRAVHKGDLKIGYSQGRNPGWIGPEYGFGWVVGEHFKDQPVLIVKIAWGGKSLHKDFRPPSAVAARGGEVGPYYKAIIEYTRDALENMGAEFPDLKGKGYRIAGFGWHQGWNDRVDKDASAEYRENLVDFIRDIRKDFGNAKLPFSITTTGMAPPVDYTAVELAQLAVADPEKFPEFKGNVKTTDTRPFWRDASVSPSKFGYHWNHNGESQYLNGTAMGQKMVELVGKQGLAPPAPVALPVENRFKPLPPGAVELDDKLGQLVDQCITNRILGLPQGWEQFVVPFEKGAEEGWAAEFWGKWATSVFLAQQYRPTDTNIIDAYRKSLYRIIATQDTDGYIGTASKDRRFTAWDVWCRKYTMHGLLAYHDLTQDANALSALTRLTDDLMAHVGPGKQLFSEGPHKGMAGATILEPVVLTYLKTGQTKYLDYADLLKDFVLPAIKQHAASHLSGHAYVHMSLCEGLLELYRATGNHDYLNAVLEYYKTTLEQEILTVGSGSNAESWWGFRNGKTAVVAQDEPDFGSLKIETCATVTWIKLNYQLLCLTGQSRYADEIEKTMYNILFRSINWDDGNYGAWIPVHKRNSSWHVGKYQWGTDVGCCAANGPRGLLLLPRLAVMRDTGVL